ncbi:ROK family protein [Thauera sp.]|uniref:ROK family protein n=1 Tax=Thauera sp. TaxID=1905334 RepID=UPI002C4FD895|nr:ROK family protein [Thauera sp.]HRO35185.1 ROK family protein [Thauera sp.]
MSTRIGIDLGGTKIELVVLDAAGCERWRRRVATPQGDYAGTLHAIAALVDEAERVTGAGARVGIGTPGSPAPRDGRIRNANSTCLNGQALQQDLEALLRRPIRLANDANCLAMSEAADGAGAGARTVFAAILGTGVGGGIVVDGKLLVGANAVAGEWGHNPLPLPEADDLPLPACYCGRAGCIETYLSGPGLAADHLRHGGESVDAVAIARRAYAGERTSQASLERYETRLARALATVINLLDPEVIVLGGGLSQVARLYDNVPRLWASHVFSDSVCTRLLPALHGDASGVRGAAWLWPAE